MVLTQQFDQDDLKVDPAIKACSEDCFTRRDHLPE
jgi:hypothetical protein